MFYVLTQLYFWLILLLISRRPSNSNWCLTFNSPLSRLTELWHSATAPGMAVLQLDLSPPPVTQWTACPCQHWWSYRWLWGLLSFVRAVQRSLVRAEVSLSAHRPCLVISLSSHPSLPHLSATPTSIKHIREAISSSFSLNLMVNKLPLNETLGN